MRPEIKLFLRDKSKKILLIKNTNNRWNKLRGVIKPCLSTLIIHFCNLIPPSNLKNYFLRNLLHMQIGKNASIAKVDFDNIFPELFSIEENGIMGHNVKILTHEITPNQFRLGRISVGKGALVGAFSSIRSGVLIGEGAIVSMSSFVNKDIPPFELWGGVPAKRIKKLKKHAEL